MAGGPDRRLGWAALLAIPVVLAGLSLAGWGLGIPRWTGWVAGQGTMKVNSALGILALAVAAWMARRGTTGAWLPAIAGAAIGAFTLAQYALGVSFGIDELLIRDTSSSLTSDPGRPSPITATALLVMGVGLAWTAVSKRTRGIVSQATGAVALLMVMLNLGVRILGATPFEGAAFFTTGMALNTVTSFLLLGTASVTMHPREGWLDLVRRPGPVAQVARRVMPWLIAVPLLAALAADLAWQEGWMDAPFALASVAVVVLAAGLVGLWPALRSLDQVDHQRAQARRALQRTNAELEDRVARRTADLERQTDLWHGLTDNVPVGVFHADADGTCRYSNPTWSLITGFREASDPTAKWWGEVHPEDREAVQAAWTRALSSDYASCRFRCVRPDGEVRWVDAGVAGLDGPDAGFVGTLQDVTPEHTLRAALDEKASTLEGILSASADHIYVFDRDMRYVYVNPAGPKALALRTEDMIGHTWHDLGFPEEIMEPFEKGVRRVFETGDPVHDETRFPLPEGTGWYDYRLTPIRDPAGRVDRVLAMVRDVTQSKQAAVALEEARQRLSEALEIADLGTWREDLTTGDMEWSDGLCDILGCEEGPPGDRWDAIKDYVVPDDAASLDQAKTRTEATGAPMDVTYRIRRPDGQIRHLHTRARRDAAGTHIVGISHDITARVEAEEQRRTAAIERRRLRDAEERERFRSRFINTAAHELATPVTSLLLQLSLLDQQVGGLGPRMETLLARLRRSAERLQQTTSDLTAAADIDAKRLTVRPKADDLAQVVRDVTARWSDEARERGMTLQVDCPERLPARIDAPLVARALDNLLDNAFKFTPDQGHVAVEARPLDAEHVRVTVRDDGAGFEAPERSIFGAMEQAHDPNAYTRSGPGLGLFVAKGIIDEHDGRIDGESDGQGQGATFWFELPTAKRPVRPRRRGEAEVGSGPVPHGMHR